MTYYETWSENSDKIVDQRTYTEYINKYYAMEKDAYETILSNFPDNTQYLKGKALEVASKLGFTADTMDIFVGFIDGINTSLKTAVDVEKIEDDTEIDLDIDYEKLYYNMRDAKAQWLYKIPSWKKILSDEKLNEITREYRDANIAHSAKVGRNDLCPCGSGKKYKKCCGKNA